MENNEGVVVNVLSVVSLVGFLGSMVYNILKFVVRGFMEILMVEFYKFFISIYNVMLGKIKIVIVDNLGLDVYKKILVIFFEVVVCDVIKSIKKGKFNIFLGYLVFSVNFFLKFFMKIWNKILWKEFVEKLGV